MPGWFSFGALGTLRRLQRAGKLAALADFLSLLVANDVPLAEAVELSSSAVGPKSLARGGKELADRLRRGESIDRAPAGFPPLLAWTIASGQSQEQLRRTLSRTAEVYRDELNRRSQWLTLYVPLMLTTLVCGGVVLGYALLTLGPWILIMRRLALP
jgi:type II secretory pathway component PulF